MEGWLYRELCCRENTFLSISFTFHLTGERNHIMTSSKSFEWLPSHTSPNSSYIFVFCELGKDGQYSDLLMEWVQSYFRTTSVFYKVDLLLGNPSKRGLRSELLQRSKGSASRPRPQYTEEGAFLFWEMKSATWEILFHFKNISLKCSLSGC